MLRCGINIGNLMRRIIIFEAKLEGHRIFYLQHIIIALRNADNLIIELMTEQPKNRDLRDLARNLKGGLCVTRIKRSMLCTFLPGFISKIVFQFRNLWVLKRLHKHRLTEDGEPPVLVITFFDETLLLSVGLFPIAFKRYKWYGVLVRPSFHLRNYCKVIEKKSKRLLEGFLLKRVVSCCGSAHFLTIDRYLNMERGFERTL